MIVEYLGERTEAIGVEGPKVRLLDPEKGGPILVHHKNMKILDDKARDFWIMKEVQGKKIFYPLEFHSPSYFINLWQIKGLLEVENFYETLTKYHPKLDTSNRKWLVP